uniref:Zinc finger, CCHC domain containing 9 n=1 Tax=Eptatretus burgeri TaxID=7764 RepID=A0A8C4R630_EPTBU
MTRWARFGHRLQPISTLDSKKGKRNWRKTKTKTSEKDDDVNGFVAFQRKCKASQGTEARDERLEVEVKRERRREERRLKRQRQKLSSKVCFQCQQPGHEMADCPQAMENFESGAGICFCCGSTEHGMQHCTSRFAEGDLPFAKCFICGEMGHLSRSCSQNPRGLYAEGGSCRTCGSVEHYQRDCTKRLREEAGDAEATASMWRPGESVDALEPSPKPRPPSPKRAKVVIF